MFNSTIKSMYNKCPCIVYAGVLLPHVLEFPRKLVVGTKVGIRRWRKTHSHGTWHGIAHEVLLLLILHTVEDFILAGFIFC